MAMGLRGEGVEGWEIWHTFNMDNAIPLTSGAHAAARGSNRSRGLSPLASSSL